VSERFLSESDRGLWTLELRTGISKLYPWEFASGSGQNRSSATVAAACASLCVCWCSFFG